MMTATRTYQCPRCGHLLRCHFVIAPAGAVQLNEPRCTVRCRSAPYRPLGALAVALLAAAQLLRGGW